MSGQYTARVLSSNRPTVMGSKRGATTSGVGMSSSNVSLEIGVLDWGTALMVTTPAKAGHCWKKVKRKMVWQSFSETFERVKHSVIEQAIPKCREDS